MCIIIYYLYKPLLIGRYLQSGSYESINTRSGAYVTHEK